MTRLGDQTRKGETMSPTIKSLTQQALAGGITQEEIDACVAQWPYMGEERWWLANAQHDPVGAIKYRLEKLEALGWKATASQWTGEELKAVVRDHKAGRPVDTDKLAEACHRGMISMSSAMNSDF